MNLNPPYLIDADVLISAKNSYYSFDICPGFWDSLILHYQSGEVFSLDRIRQELLAGREDDQLVRWTHKEVPAGFFLTTQDKDVVAAFTEIMLWVQRNTQYYDSAKAKFATEADGWLVAFARVRGVMVITNEQPRPESRSRILLPDVCDRFGVKYDDTFAMLRALRVRYENVESY
ncbi:MAG: DUF4411 family protein [Chromatiaceae bacterium]|nr:DUF4411 family protein [Chromatiaceae bacterium]